MARINYYLNVPGSESARSSSVDIARYALESITHRFSDAMGMADKRALTTIVPFLPARTALVFSMVIGRNATSLVAEDYMFLDAAVFGAMKRSCGADWSTMAFHQLLPPTGSGEGHVSVIPGNVGAVRRYVDNGTQPNTADIPGNPIIPATVTDSSVPEHLNTHVNGQVGDGIQHVGNQFDEWIAANRTPLYFAGSLLGLVAVVVIVKNVREIL